MLEANYAVDQSAVMENTLPDPVTPLRWAVRSAWAMYALLALLVLVFPVYAWIYITLVVPLTACMLFAYRIVAREERDYIEMFKSRADFSLTVPLVHPEDAALEAADRAVPRSQRRQRWVRQIFPAATSVPQTETVHRPDGSTAERTYWRYRIATPAHRQECLAMAAYLKERCPAVYAVVSAWWRTTIGDKIAGQLWIGRAYADLAAEQQREVRARGELELLAGMFIGLRPDTWGERFDRRPFFRDFYTLRLRLADEVAEAQRPSEEIVDGAPWPERCRRNYIYVGQGFNVDERIAIRYYWQKFRRLYPAQDWLRDDDRGPALLRVPGLARPLTAIWRAAKRTLLPGYTTRRTLMEEASTDDAARWVLGLGWRQLAPQWTHYDRDLQQHSMIAGGSGYGKTVLLQPMLIQAVYNGSSVVLLDPKVDKSTVSLLLYHAMLAGRLDDVVMLSVSRSDCPYNSTMNPLSGFFDPSQIGNILAGLMPESAGENQYFLDDARNIGRIVGTMVHWIGQFLTLLSDGDPVARRPPRLLMWLEYAARRTLYLPRDTTGSVFTVEGTHYHIAQERAAFQAIWQRLVREGNGFVAANELETGLFKMWMQPEYTSRYWRLNFGHLLEFALNNRQRLVSWVMRIIYPYVCAHDDRFLSPTFPLSDTLEMVSGFVPRNRQQAQQEGPPPPSLLELFERSGPHVLARNALLTADRTKTMWGYLYESEISVEAVHKLQETLVRTERAFQELIGQARRDPEEYGQGVANLRPVVNEIVAGEKFDLLCVPEPDLTWPRIHHEKKIVILMLGSMSDQKASDAVSKAFVQSLLGYAGYIQDRGAQDLDLLFAGDEFFSWANSSWAHIVDKCRSTGIRTVVLCQSEAGMRYALHSPDLFKHIKASVRNGYTCTTNQREDQEAMVEGIAKVPIITPSRTVGEQPAAAGEAASVGIAGWGTSENWSWKPELQPLIDPEMLGWLPKGVFVRRVNRVFTVFQAPKLKEAPFTLQSLYGLDDRADVLVEGVHYANEALVDTERLRTWGQDRRLETVLEREDTFDPDEVAAAITPSGTPQGYRQVVMSLTPPEDDGSTAVLDDDEDAPEVLPAVSEAKTAPPGLQSAGGAVLADPSSDDLTEVSDHDEDPGVHDAQIERLEQERCAVHAACEEWSLAEVREADGQLARGAVEPSGVRVGHWFVYDQEGHIAAEGYYHDGKRTGAWTFRNAESEIVRTTSYNEGIEVSIEIVAPPVPVAAEELPPGPLPRPHRVDETDEDGYRYIGLRRGTDLRVGMWDIFRPDGTRAEIHHYDMTTGKPTGLWERYDERGDIEDTYSPTP